MNARAETAAAARIIPPIQLAAAAIVAFVVLVQGISAPFQKDAEPQSAEWIVSVVRDGNWLVPRDYYEFIDRKPPLYYWLSAIVTKATGGTVDETRARIVSVFCATLIALEVLAWTASEVGVAQGWLAFLFLLGIYGFSSRATLALTDMLMTALLMSAYLVAYPMLEGEASLARTAVLGCLLGLGILTKGPLVLILIGLAGVIYLLLGRRDVIAALRRAWPWQAAALAVAIGACWYVPWLAIGGRRELGIFLNENLGHFAPRAFGGTGEASRPIWYILARLIGGANPVILLAPATLAAFATGEVRESARRPLLFQASFVAAVILFFSVASAKRDDYILPALPAVAILSAGAFGLGPPATGFAGGAKIRDGVCWLIAFAALLAVVLSLVTARSHPQLSLQSSDSELMMLLERGIGSRALPFVAFLAVSSVAAIAAIVLLSNRSILLAGFAIGLVSLSGVVLMDAIVRPELAWARGYKSFVERIRRQLDGHRLFVVRDADFELSFYYGSGVPPLTGTRAVAPPVDTASMLIARDAELAMLPESYRGRLRLIEKSNLLSKEGAPALYLIEVRPGGLNGGGGIAR